METADQLKIVNAMKMATRQKIEIKLFNLVYTRPEYDLTPATNKAIAQLLNQRSLIAREYFKTHNKDLIEMFDILSRDVKEIIGL